MDNSLKGLIDALGAISESLGIMRDQLLKQGFTRLEAVKLCGDMLITLLSQSSHGGDQ